MTHQSPPELGKQSGGRYQLIGVGMPQNTVRVEYNGELIAAGERVACQNVFWTAIRLDPSFSASAVHDRLVEIRHADRVHFEWRGVDWVAFPPAYSVLADDSIAAIPRG